MEKKKLAQGVKDLRKQKGLSQEDLSKKSGLSLRTIQRVENGETEPTGETLNRISSVLEVTPFELIDWGSDKENLKKTVKTKYEYLHVFDNKILITKTEEINDLVDDYGKSVNNVFKTLMVFFIGIPIFTALIVIFYNLGKIGLAINSGAFALMFLVAAFQIILFTSGSSLIKLENISKIRIQKKSNLNVVRISHTESGRLKDRTLILEENQVENVKNILLSEKLIEEKDINLKGYKISIHTFIMALLIIAPFYFLFIKRSNEMMAYYFGAIMLFGSTILMIKMILKLIIPMFNKTTNR